MELTWENYDAKEIDRLTVVANTKTREVLKRFHDGGKKMLKGILNFSFLLRLQSERSRFIKYWDFETVESMDLDNRQRASKHKLDHTWIRKTTSIVTKRRRIHRQSA